MPVLLAIDDDVMMLHTLRSVFRDVDLTFLTAMTAAEGLSILNKQKPDAILLDLLLPDMSGLEAFRRIQQQDPKIPVIFVTGRGTTETAIEAMKLGAFEYLVKENLLEPTETARLRAMVQRAFEISRFTHVPALVPEDAPTPGPSETLIGRCPAMQEIYKAIGRVASQDVPVLIMGETGTGKELVARAVYHHSRRATAPFLAVNCAAIPETLLESELFGHEKGAFTGADRKRIGKFEQASGGTLLLDEVGDMTSLTQAKILRVLQEQRFERVGGNETIHTDVRIIAATNQDLGKMVTDGRFRADLYYRLAVASLRLPPLRERGQDVRLLAEHFLRLFSKSFGKDVRQIAPETFALLHEHSWPGNVRELQSVIKQSLLQSTGAILLPEFLPAYLHPRSSGPQTGPAVLAPDHEASSSEWIRFVRQRLQDGSTELYAEAMAIPEAILLREVMEAMGGNQVQASRALGVSRNRLRAKLEKLGLSVKRSICAKEDQVS